MEKVKKEAVNNLLEKIARETNLQIKRDFFLNDKVQLKEKKNEEWILLKFKKVKGESTTERKKVVTNFLKNRGIEIHEPTRKDNFHGIYIKVLNIKMDPEEKSNSLLKELEKVHMEVGILGVPNIDQADLPESFCNFNYINEKEMIQAENLFLEAGIEFLERNEKPCNLSFLLDFDKIKKIKKLKRTFLGEEAIDVFVWILKKIYRKKIVTLPKYLKMDYPVEVSYLLQKAKWKT